MNISLNIVRIILIISFGVYEIGAFRSKKSLPLKLLPMILSIALALLLLALASFMGPIGYFFIFAILIVELSIIGTILVFLLEICVALFSPNRNLKRILFLTMVFILLIGINYLSQRVF